MARVRLKGVAAPEASAALVVHVSTPAASVQRESEVEAVVLAGIVSFTTTPGGTAEGPLFVRVKMGRADVRTPVTPIARIPASERKAELITVSVFEAVLVAGLGS